MKIQVNDTNFKILLDECLFDLEELSQQLINLGDFYFHLHKWKKLKF